MIDRPLSTNMKLNGSGELLKDKKKKKIRRSINKKKLQNEVINIMYSNIQGFTKKKESLMHIMDELDCDICLLAETLTRSVKMKGCRCITPSKSVGQNVCIIVRNRLIDKDIIKMYDPNDSANMIGVRIDFLGSGLRVYTAHMKQQSACTRDEIAIQFDEVRSQFQDAAKSNEAMIIIFDANAHLGKEVISGCDDEQDWVGKVLVKLIEEENLILLNALELCEGIVTRIDPRDGKVSTIDVAICNQFMSSKIVEMKIDECEQYKPTNYASTIKKTDHNTIMVKTKIERSAKKKMTPYINTKGCEGREIFRKYVEDSNIQDYIENSPVRDSNLEFETMMEFWNEAINVSFKKITPKRNSQPGINAYVRDLMREEQWIRDNIIENPERGRRIADIRKKIREEIGKNRAEEILSKVSTIREAKNPQSEIFKIRRSRKKVEKVGFPLQDEGGTIRVTKDGIDKVIIKHFDKVFKQNPVPSDQIWCEYWSVVDEVFDLMKKNKSQKGVHSLPTFQEIKNLIWATNDKKSVLGSMTSELVKLGGDKVIGLIHRVILSCCVDDDIPDQMRNEKMVLLYKNKGKLTDLDNYRGIFLRLLCLSILQKWLYQKCSPIVEISGSEYAFGGRKERSVSEVLLIVRLVQDYSNWKKQPLILKFLDVTKFFDMMNYKKCLIEAYQSGVMGQYWRMYAAINQKKQCTPLTPLGECQSIDVKELFSQGSCDAMIMAWNLVDAINKSSGVNDPVVVIDGVEIPRTLFVDDILEIVLSFFDLNVTLTGNETFEKSNRICFKPCKCKIICCNCTPTDDIKINEAVLEVVKDHEYLGSIISEKGRRNDLLKRIASCKGVSNEIVEICRTEGVNELCLAFMTILIDACFKSKFKHGCEVWDSFNKMDLATINRLLPNMSKRILQMPGSTPTVAVKHDLGIIDLDLEVGMERILLASKILEMDDSRISKRLLISMMEKRVPGFCVNLEESLEMFGISDITELSKVNDKRKHMKKDLIEMQKKRNVEDMLKGSKTDQFLEHFSYDGHMKSYLLKLPFKEARIMFMWRSRMFPTKCNFPNRWSKSMLCGYCLSLDTDEHLLSCCGYVDIHQNMLNHHVFWLDDSDTEELRVRAQILQKIYDRLLMMHEDGDVTCHD